MNGKLLYLNISAPSGYVRYLSSDLLAWAYMVELKRLGWEFV